MRVDQLVPAFHRGDAIGDEAFELRNFFRSRGFASDIYCLTRDRGCEDQARLFSEFEPPSAADIVFFHFALPSPLTGELVRMPCRKALIYHNITPAEFFTGLHPEMARNAELGRLELGSLQPHIDLSLADSEFNRLELESLGFRRTHAFPLFVDFRKYEKPMDRFIFDLFRDGRVNVLFVGRVAPNKRIENLIKTVFYYKKFISPLVRLTIVGKTETFPSYYRSVVEMADEFYLKSEEVRFVGHVSDEEMFALYRAADVFLSLSEHEGFCLPLIESMIFDLPIVALDSTAVPYTLGGAGIMVENSRPDYVAELVDVVARDEAVRRTLIDSGRRELEKFKAFPRETFLMERLAELGARPGSGSAGARRR
jgi:glycosyltransferase involved in cell wall biosynthesis